MSEITTTLYHLARNVLQDIQEVMGVKWKILEDHLYVVVIQDTTSLLVIHLDIHKNLSVSVIFNSCKTEIVLAKNQF